MAWYSTVLAAPDQLRHRVAFALSQILVAGVEGIGKSDESELWLNWYDIFVRHAFGSYRSILREVSYSPMMSTYLTYHNNKAYAVGGTNPDENYAREVMQVSTPGLEPWSTTVHALTVDLRSSPCCESSSQLASGSWDRTASRFSMTRHRPSPPMTTGI